MFNVTRADIIPLFPNDVRDVHVSDRASELAGTEVQRSLKRCRVFKDADVGSHSGELNAVSQNDPTDFREAAIFQPCETVRFHQ